MAEPTTLLLKTPRRFLFIASIGNFQAPYRYTRHSAGHVLLDALVPLLPARIPFVPSRQPTTGSGPVFYKTWYSPSFMNESGPKLVRQLQNWITTRKDILAQSVQRGEVVTATATTATAEWQRRGVDPRTLTRFQPTLVILHDEMEAPLGKLRVRRGGPEKFSLRGHRGLISVMESLRGKGLYPPPGGSKGAAVDFQLSVLRIGVGIGRPSTREKNAVADYVLTEMNEKELQAVRAAAQLVVDLLADELYREKEES